MVGNGNTRMLGSWSNIHSFIQFIEPTEIRVKLLHNWTSHFDVIVIFYSKKKIAVKFKG